MLQRERHTRTRPTCHCCTLSWLCMAFLFSSPLRFSAPDRWLEAWSRLVDIPSKRLDRLEGVDVPYSLLWSMVGFQRNSKNFLFPNCIHCLLQCLARSPLAPVVDHNCLRRARYPGCQPLKPDDFERISVTIKRLQLLG